MGGIFQNVNYHGLFCRILSIFVTYLCQKRGYDRIIVIRRTIFFSGGYEFVRFSETSRSGEWRRRVPVHGRPCGRIGQCRGTCDRVRYGGGAAARHGLHARRGERRLPRDLLRFEHPSVRRSDAAARYRMFPLSGNPSGDPAPRGDGPRGEKPLFRGIGRQRGDGEHLPFADHVPADASYPTERLRQGPAELHPLSGGG